MPRADHKTTIGTLLGQTAIDGGQEAATATREGKRFGWMVAVRRTELGLSQSELAARMHTSRSEVTRIEAGHRPSAETVKQLAAVLDGEPGVHGPGRSIARAGAIDNLATTPRDPPVGREPREPLDRRRLWAGLAALVLIPLLVIGIGRLAGGGGGEPTESLEPVSALPALSAAAERAQHRVQAQERAQAEIRAAKAAAREAKQARAEAILVERREAAAARKEEQAAPAASSEAGGDSFSEPVSPPVYTPPPAPSGGGSNGGGSQGRPDVSHGIGG
jgi:transcriptional regulator with XRE-family HTH domain